MNTDNLKVKLNIAHAVTAFLAAAVLYVIILAVCGITPLGDNTWIVYDMKRQYVDYYAYFKSILAGENNIFYSFSTALGSGIMGLFVYYMTSPFLLLTVIFPIDMLPQAVTVIIGLKLSLSAFTADCMLQKLCGRSAYICSLSYAFCAYMISNATNLMWLDVLIMLPVVLIMTEKLLHEGKLLGYTVSIAIILFLNYYMSYIVIIFVVLWSVARLWIVKNKSPQEAILRLGIATGAGIGIDAAFLLPVAVEIRNYTADILRGSAASERTDIFIADIISKQFALAYDSMDIYWGKPLIYCGILLIILALFYFLNRNISLRERVAMGALFIVFFISFAFDRVNTMWHIGVRPSEYPYREAVLFVLLMVICSCRALGEFRNGLSPAAFAVAGIVTGVLSGVLFRHQAAYMSAEKLRYNLILALTLFILVTVMYIVRRKPAVMMVCMLLMVIHAADLGVNSTYIYKTESMSEERASEYSEATASIGRTVALIRQQNMKFYRMDNWIPRQQNDAMMHGYMGVTHYSLAGLDYVRYFLQKLGYNDDGIYTDYGHDNTETADSLLGIRYIMTDREHGYRMHDDYELIVDEAVQAYENPYALPLGVGVYREMSGETMDPFTLQEDIYGRLAGKPVDIFIPAQVEYEEIDDSRPVRVYDVTAAADGELYFYMSDLIGTGSNMEIYADYEFIAYYGNASCIKVLNLGRYEKGEHLTMHVIADDEGEFGSALFVTEDTRALAETYDTVGSRRAEVTRLSASRLAMTLDSAYTVGDDISGEVGVFTTIPYQRGWNVRVAGVKVEPVEVYDALMYIPVTEALQQAELGPDEDIRIELSFIPEGLYLGIGVSILSLAVVILMASIRRGEAGFFGDDYDENEDEEDDKE